MYMFGRHQPTVDDGLVCAFFGFYFYFTDFIYNYNNRLPIHQQQGGFGASSWPSPTQFDMSPPGCSNTNRVQCTGKGRRIAGSGHVTSHQVLYFYFYFYYFTNIHVQLDNYYHHYKFKCNHPILTHPKAPTLNYLVCMYSHPTLATIKTWDAISASRALIQITVYR